MADEPAPQGPALLATELICRGVASVPTHRAWPHQQLRLLPFLTSEVRGKLGLGSEGGCGNGYFREDHGVLTWLGRSSPGLHFLKLAPGSPAVA